MSQHVDDMPAADDNGKTQQIRILQERLEKVERELEKKVEEPGEEQEEQIQEEQEVLLSPLYWVALVAIGFFFLAPATAIVIWWLNSGPLVEERAEETTAEMLATALTEVPIETPEPASQFARVMPESLNVYRNLPQDEVEPEIIGTIGADAIVEVERVRELRNAEWALILLENSTPGWIDASSIEMIPSDVVATDALTATGMLAELTPVPVEEPEEPDEVQVVTSTLNLTPTDDITSTQTTTDTDDLSGDN